MIGEWRLEFVAALRRLRARPAFVLAAVTTVGIGIGVNLALVNLTLGFFYQERAVPESSRILWIGVVPEDASDPTPIPPPGRVVAELGDIGTWDGAAGWTGSLASVSVAGAGTSSRWVRLVTPRFYELQGIRAAAGRLFAQDETDGGVPTAVLGSRFAERQFGSSSAALGGHVRVNGVPHEVVGVLEASFDEGDFGVSVPLSRPDTASYLRSFVHFRTEELREAGRSELSREVARALLEVDFRTARVVTGGEKEVTRGPGLPFEPTPFGLSLILLLTAGFNLTAIMLARGQEQVRSAALRRLLGAGRWRLVRPLIVESTIVAVLATAVGFLAAAWALDIIASGFPTDAAPLLNRGLLTIALGLTAAIILLTGVWPAFATQVVEARGVLRTRATSTVTGPGWLRGLHVLLTAQFVLAVPMVLAGLGLTARAVADAERGVGFAPAGLVEHTRFPEASSEEVWDDLVRVERRLAADGGVQATALLQTRVLTDPADLELGHTGWAIETAAPPRAPRWVRVSPGGLRALGVPLIEGRWPAEVEGERAVLVNETAARRWFPDGDAIGGTARLRVNDGPWLTVVGVVGDVRDQPLFQETAPPALYAAVPVGGRSSVTLYARARDEGSSASVAMRAAIEAELPGAAGAVRSTESEVARATSAPRVAAQGAVLASAFVVLLVATGLYGLLVVIVSRRTFDLAVRVALGARALRVVASVAGPAAQVATTGIALGCAVWWMLGRFSGVDLPGLADAPAGIMIAFATVLSIVVGSAVAPPVLRAVRSDPASALRGSE